MKLQEWLRFPSIDDRRAAIAKAHQDTFRWVLLPSPSTDGSSNPGSDFVEWLRNGSGVYWIQGKMGCGKSTLMKYLTGHESTGKHLLEWASGKTLHCLSYYFSKTGTSELQKSLQGLYRTLLATLIQHENGLFRVAFPYWQLSDFKHEPNPKKAARSSRDNSHGIRILMQVLLLHRWPRRISGNGQYAKGRAGERPPRTCMIAICQACGF